MWRSLQASFLAFCLSALPGCADEPDPGAPPPGSGSGNVTTDPGSGGGHSTTDATASATGSGSASGSGSGSGTGTGGGSGSGSTGGIDPYGPCLGPSCPGGQVCMESLQSPGFNVCTDVCLSDTDCQAPSTGTASPVCAPDEVGSDTVCRLDCSGGEDCPDGAVCLGVWCWNG